MGRSFFTMIFANRWTAPLVAIVLTLTTAVALAWAVNTTVSEEVAAERVLVRLALLSGEISRLDEALTASARLSATSGDMTWKARYDADVPRLDTAINEAMKLSKSPAARTALAATATSNLRLIELETAGFEFARVGDLDRARALVLGQRYQSLKSTYSAGLSEALAVARATAVRHSEVARNRLLLLLVIGVGALLTIAALWLAIILRNETRRVEVLKAKRDLLELDRRKSLEGQELSAALATAESANRAKSEFLANMSHELRTPLNGVLGVAGVLLNTGLTTEQTEMTSLIVASARTLEAILGDILDLSKIEAGRVSIENGAFDLAGEIGLIAELMRTRADERGLKFELRVDAAAADGMFIGDSLRIKQVIGNLLSNAIKFTPNGSVTLAVRIEDEADDRCRVLIEVTDTGIGFEEAASHTLFDRFVQADGSITRRFGGTGLGLAISQSLVEMMGGAIAGTSQLGCGSTFTVELPLSRVWPVAEVATVEAGALAAGLSGDDEGGLRILLAEDHVVNQRVVDLILRPYGVDLTIVDDGAQAVAITKTKAFDLILMDMQMPVMDGLTAIKAIRRMELEDGRPRTPIAIVSANAMAEHRKASLASGADMHVAKPFSPDTLIAEIHQLLALSAPPGERALEAAS